MGFQEFGIHFCAVPVMRANVLAGMSGGLRVQEFVRCGTASVAEVFGIMRGQELSRLFSHRQAGILKGNIIQGFPDYGVSRCYLAFFRSKYLLYTLNTT